MHALPHCSAPNIREKKLYWLKSGGDQPLCAAKMDDAVHSGKYQVSCIQRRQFFFCGKRQESPLTVYTCQYHCKQQHHQKAGWCYIIFFLFFFNKTVVFKVKKNLNLPDWKAECVAVGGVWFRAVNRAKEAASLCSHTSLNRLWGLKTNDRYVVCCGKQTFLKDSCFIVHRRIWFPCLLNNDRFYDSKCKICHVTGINVCW